MIDTMVYAYQDTLGDKDTTTACYLLDGLSAEYH